MPTAVGESQVIDNSMTTTTGITCDWKILWAKSVPRHPLWKHMLDAAAVSLALRFPIPDSGWTDEAIAFLTGLHDVGKADSCFQHQVSDFSGELVGKGYTVTGDAKCRHERISARFVKEWLTAKKLDDYTADAVSRTIIVHHGYWNETARASGEKYAEAQQALCDMLSGVLGSPKPSEETPQNLSAFGMCLAGHIVLCDWIASNEEFFCDARLQNVDDPKTYFEAAKEVACDWAKRLDLERGRNPENPVSIVAHARPIQQMLLDTEISPGLVIIEAPMGEGKTEAAWILAEKWRAWGYQGMYMALPTMATSDSLFLRYRDDYLKKRGDGDDVKLVHGMAWLRDDKEPEKSPETGEPGDDRSLAAAWFRPTRRAMLAAHGVGTVDQAMLAGMNVKFGFLRLYGLSGRVLVIDEVHAYDAYMSAIIARLLQWCACMKIPVILLSATLSSHQRASMIEAYGATGGDPGPNAPYPLITVAKPGKDAETFSTEASSQRTLKIETLSGLLGDAKKTARKAEELVNGGGCCCVILNTVKQAQAVYRELGLKKDNPKEKQEEQKEGRKLLFHARFAAADRQRITERVLEMFGKNSSNRPEKFVLVATQVVEQSLDVDFDHMISEIAPIDLLLQRSGRIKRHSRATNGKRIDGDDQRGAPILYVLTPVTEDNSKFGASEKIYQRFPLLQTLNVLNGITKIEADANIIQREKESLSIPLPAGFRPLIETVYAESLKDTSDDDVVSAKQIWDDLQEDLAAQAGEFLLCEPMKDEFDPVGADEVGDDSDDGNGWRARTRLGLEDIHVIPIESANQKKLEALAQGECTAERVKERYEQSIKIPPHYWPPKPAKGYLQPLLGMKKLRGVWLLPVKKDENGWEWSGIKKEDKKYTIRYDSEIGLTHGGDK